MQGAEDIVQDTFIQYYTNKKEFDSEQHIRAWLIRVAINKAKNINHTFWKRNIISLEDYMETLTFETPESDITELFHEDCCLISLSHNGEPVYLEITREKNGLYSYSQSGEPEYDKESYTFVTAD